MRLATTTCDFSDYITSQEQAFYYIRLAGFKYVDYSFEMEYYNKDGIFGQSPEKHIENVKKEADKQGIQLVQAHSPMGAPIKEGNEQFALDTIKCIEACGEWGIKNLVVHTGYTEGLTKEETLKKNKEFFLKLMPCAEKHGVNILVENFNKMCIENLYWIDNTPDLLELIEDISHPLLHAVFDTGHANMQEMPQDEALKILGKHVYALHVQDNFGNSDSHMAPFFGTLNLDSLMHGLLDIGYNGYFTFEASRILSNPKSKKHFEKDNRLLMPPVDLKIKAESLLYEIGKHILSEYDCFEE